jgi:PTS system N-acetylglucosamine-specific IIC component
LRAVEACTTRLRLVVADVARFDEPALKAMGSRGVLKLGDGAVQVVVGPIADQRASEIRAALKQGGTVAPPPEAAPADGRLVAQVLAALGGRGNIAELELRSSRLCIGVRDPAAVDEASLAHSVRAVARPAPRSIHLVVGPGASALFAGMRLS